ncbi:MAG: NAD(P)H-dependent oxidoreductase [Betaproteobacteria bacterium]
MTKLYDLAVIIGNLREVSYNRNIAQIPIESAPAQLRLEVVEIAQSPPYSRDYDEATPPAEYSSFRQRIVRADAALFVTSEHNRSLPAALKNALLAGDGDVSAATVSEAIKRYDVDPGKPNPVTV